ncbi:MAG: Hpt domain-containing protein [Nitrospinaceae bacterium]|nr:Hpt domain-containing protein [Nitrospinaceae bacterium]NIS86072.1 Hpt domain-containing protein [Nitrospinaceae bacterium]NIT82916.1 Hpt domain-containing protein [Nitrospinaceae bacterium]NIU97297.1 Hpt domain-containing protein [Nitrospinaceae bacterium]NIW06704.1 Hpt domain-containing protein [Nitrospinaceae bacterium]
MANSSDPPPKDRIIVRVDPDLEELIPTYLDNRRKDLLSIGEALKQEDFSTVQRLGHTMKGSGAGYGFDFISAVGLQIEDAAREGSEEKIQNFAGDLRDFLDRVEVVFE